MYAIRSYYGYIGAEIRAFPQSPEWAGQDDAKFHPSVFAKAELGIAWDGDRQSINIAPYVRIDGKDDNRTHADLREASYMYRGDGWDAVVGWHQVFWGRAESRHLVNVINQVDSYNFV